MKAAPQKGQKLLGCNLLSRLLIPEEICAPLKWNVSIKALRLSVGPLTQADRFWHPTNEMIRNFTKHKGPQ